MQAEDWTMRMHRYSGRENGLMIIGSAPELRALGKMLITFSESSPDLSPGDWPPLIGDVPLDGGGDFSLSFHLDTTSKSKPKTNFPFAGWWRS